MAVTATILASGRVFGGLSGPWDLFLQWAITTGIGQKSRAVLANGDNTITIPSGTTLVAVVPPTGNTQALKWKGNAADTGTPMQKTTPFLASWDTGVATTLIINAAGAVTVDVLCL